MISAVHVWRQATGGGLPVDYLRWLAAMWVHWTTATPDGVERMRHMTHLVGPDIAPVYLREPFMEWLAAKFNT